MVPDSHRRTAPAYAWTGRKLGLSVLAYVFGVIAVITLEPFAFRVPTHVDVMLWDGWFDPVANVALFVPAGFLYGLAWSAHEADPAAPRARRRLLGRAAWLGVLASAMIETTQLFEPARYPSPTDVATNAAGALLGAWLYLRAARRLGADTPIVGRLALELPLMGLLYVAAPLCTLAALTLGGGAAARGPGLAALGLFGGTLVGHVQRWHFGPAGTLRPAQAALAAAAWMAAGALPAVATAPWVFAASVAVAAAAAWGYGTERVDRTGGDRRFERAALVRAVPWLAAYLVLVPLTEPAESPAILGKLDVLRRVETLAGFTVLGYVLAEAWGRLGLRYRWTAWRVGAVAVMAAIAGAALRRMGAPSLDDVAPIGLSTVAAAYGGWLYHLQRAHVLALVEARDRGGRIDPAASVMHVTIESHRRLA